MSNRTPSTLEKARLRKEKIDAMRQSPELHRAIAIGRVSYLEFVFKAYGLVELPFDIHAVDLHGETPLEVALRFDRAEIVGLLLSRGARFPAREILLSTDQSTEAFKFTNNVYEKASRLALAIDTNKPSAEVESLLDEMGDGQNMVLNNIFEALTPLHRATEQGNMEIAELLLKRLVQRNMKVTQWDLEGNPPMHRAVRNGNSTEFVDLLMKYKARLSDRNIRGESIFCYRFHEKSRLVLASILDFYERQLDQVSDQELKDSLKSQFFERLGSGDWDLPNLWKYQNFIKCLETDIPIFRKEFNQEDFDALFPTLVKGVVVGEHGQTRLHDAAQKNSTVQVCELLASGEQSLPDSEGRYPIDLAKNPEVRECFIRDHRDAIQRLTSTDGRVDFTAILPVVLWRKIEKLLNLKDLVDLSQVNQKSSILLLRDPTACLYRVFANYLPVFLLLACQNNNVPMFNLCLQRGKGDFVDGYVPEEFFQYFLERPGGTPLEKTFTTGNIDFAGRLIDAGAEIPRTALNTLITQGQFAMGRLLLQKGTYISEELVSVFPVGDTTMDAVACKEELQTALQRAAALVSAIGSQDLEAVKDCLRQGANLKMIYESLSLFQHAVRSGNMDIVRVLKEAGATLGGWRARDSVVCALEQKDNRQLAILLTCDLPKALRQEIVDFACKQDSTELVAACLVVMKKSKKKALLIKAAKNGSLRVIEYLVSQGIRVKPDAMFSASTIEVMKVLRAQGLSYFLRDAKKGGTLLFVAETIDVAQFLLAQGLQIAAVNKKNQTAMHYAISSRKPLEFVQYLIDAGANLTAKAEWFWDGEYSPLDLAKSYGLTKLQEAIQLAIDEAQSLALLIDGEQASLINDFLSQHPNRINNIYDSMTPLHRAIECENSKIVTLLVRRGANLQGWDEAGATPLHRATRKQNIELVKLLLENGARVDERNAEGKSALRDREYGLLPAIKILFINKYLEIFETIKDKLLREKLIQRFNQAMTIVSNDLPDLACVVQFVKTVNTCEFSSAPIAKCRALNVILLEPCFASLAPLLRLNAEYKRSVSWPMLSIFKLPSERRVALLNDVVDSVLETSRGGL